MGAAGKSDGGQGLYVYLAGGKSKGIWQGGTSYQQSLGKGTSGSDTKLYTRSVNGPALAIASILSAAAVAFVPRPSG